MNEKENGRITASEGLNQLGAHDSEPDRNFAQEDRLVKKSEYDSSNCEELISNEEIRAIESFKNYDDNQVEIIKTQLESYCRLMYRQYSKLNMEDEDDG